MAPTDALQRAPISRRDYFAAAALTGIIAAHGYHEVDMPREDTAARWALQYADQLIAYLDGTEDFGPKDKPASAGGDKQISI